MLHRMTKEALPKDLQDIALLKRWYAIIGPFIKYQLLF